MANRIVIALGGNALQNNPENISTEAQLKAVEKTAVSIVDFIEEGQFAPGSMLPKVKAAIKFAKSKKGRRAIITSLDKAKDCVIGEVGTKIEGYKDC